MIKRLDIFLIRAFTGPFIATFFISLFILLMQFLWKYVEDLVGKGLEWYIIAKLMVYVSASLVPMALPLAILLASIMTYGNLGEYYELTAIKASGISLRRVMMPIMVISFFISIGAFLFSNYVLPFTNPKMVSILYDVTHQRPEINIKPGIFNNDIEGFSIKVGKKSKKSNMMYDFMIYDHSQSMGNQIVTLADSGTMVVTDDNKSLVVTLYNGQRYEESAEQNYSFRNYPARYDKFEKQTIIVDLKNFEFASTDENLFKKNYNTLDLEQLNYAIDSLNKIYTERRKVFNTTLQLNFFFRFEIKVFNPNDTFAVKKDSAIRYTTIENLPIVKNIDSIYAKMKKNEKNEVIDIAIDYAKRAQTTVLSTLEDLYSQGKWMRKHEIAWHNKLVLSVACLLFFFIGAPMGAIIRKGGFGLPIIVSIFFFITYYIIWMMGQKSVREGVLPAYFGVWISTFVIIPIGILLTYKATTDSTLFNTDAYLNILKNINTRFSNLKLAALFRKNKIQNENSVINQ